MPPEHQVGSSNLSGRAIYDPPSTISVDPSLMPRACRRSDFETFIDFWRVSALMRPAQNAIALLDCPRAAISPRPGEFPAQAASKTRKGRPATGQPFLQGE